MLIAVVPIITITTKINMIKDLKTSMVFTRNACFAWELNPTALWNLENHLAQEYHKRVHTVQKLFLLQILNMRQLWVKVLPALVRAPNPGLQ